MPTSPHRALTLLLALVLSLLAPIATQAQPIPAGLPEAEKALVHTTDPWGSSFSDQLAIHRAYFKDSPDTLLAVGYTHALTKIWQNKYFFHGDQVFTKAANTVSNPVWGVTGGAVSFQIAILPKIGTPDASYRITVQAPVPTQTYRQEFVDVGPAAYPRLDTSLWPDPLIQTDTCQLQSTQAGVFLIEANIPTAFKDKTFTCHVKITREKDPPLTIDVPVRVVQLTLGPSPLPLVAMFDKTPIGDAGYQASIDMSLKHRLQPLDPGFLQEVWKKQGADALEKELRARMAKGQTVFYISPNQPDIYEFLKTKNLLQHFITQVGPDEPDAPTFKSQNIPQVLAFRQKFPGLNILLASMPHPDLAQGCDIHLNDLSFSTYDPRNPRPKEPPQLWHYYCHLPIQADYRAPLVQAPNMQIDNPALEHRLAIWMSWHYGARGVFIWSGNSELPAKDFWKNRPLKLDQAKATFPYGGTHHGNGFLVYPPVEPDGPAIPSLRLKILRDAMEDIAIFHAIKNDLAPNGPAPTWLSPVPEVFQHPHYFDQLPQALLAKRQAILQTYDKLKSQEK